MAGIKRRAMENPAEGTTAASIDDIGGDDDGKTSVYTLRPNARWKVSSSSNGARGRPAIRAMVAEQ